MKVTVHRAAKISVGNYENTDIAVTLEEEISEGAAKSAVLARLAGEAQTFITNEVTRILTTRTATDTKVRKYG